MPQPVDVPHETHNNCVILIASAKLLISYWYTHCYTKVYSFCKNNYTEGHSKAAQKNTLIIVWIGVWH